MRVCRTALDVRAMSVTYDEVLEAPSVGCVADLAPATSAPTARSRSPRAATAITRG
jgi:hypothetical protein